MVVNVESLSPSGIKRKIVTSPVIDGDGASGSDYIIAHFNHGVKLLSIKTVPVVSAFSANASSTPLDIGTAVDGDTVLDGAVLTDSQALGVSAELINSPGTNGGLRELPPNTTLFCEIVTQDVDGTDFVIVVEYEDISE